MQLGVDPRRGLGAQPHQPGAVPDQRDELALLDRLAVHLGDESGEQYAGEKRRVDRVALVARLGDRTKFLRMHEHEARDHAVEQVVEPRPRRACLDDDLDRGMALEKLDQPVAIRVADPQRLLHQRASIVHDPDHDIRCVSIDSCDMHVGLLVVASAG